MLNVTTPEYMIHPRTGEPLYPLGITRRGKTIWPVLGAADDDDIDDEEPDDDDDEDVEEPDDDEEQKDEPKKGRGFPANTPLSEMTVEQREKYWIHQARKHEQRLKSLGDVDDLLQRAGQYDALEEASRTEQERAVADAKSTARTETLKEIAPRLVGAEFRVQSAGRLSADQVKELIEDLDMTKYLTAKGEVDVDRVTRKVNALAPKSDKDGKRRGPDLGQGRRDQSKNTGTAAGRQMWEDTRRPATSTST